ncbi:MAG: aminopeptidase YwaD [Candidatus Paceibacteria bacterium]
MIDFINVIVKKHGGRIAGSPQERASQLDFKETLQQHCHDVKIQEFSAPLGAKFQSLPVFAAVYIFAIYLYSDSVVFAVALAAVNATLFLGHFVFYGGWLNPLFPKKHSLNIDGVIPASAERRATVYVCGHMDSVYEFWWWYALGHTGVVLTTVGMIIIATQPIVLALGWFQFLAVDFVSLGLFFFLLPLIFMKTYRKVDGAMDNLSGVAISLDIAKHFGLTRAHQMLHTEIRILSFGSEETGLMGSTAYVKKFFKEMKQENVHVLNIDSVGDMKYLTAVTHELFPRVSYTQHIIEGVVAAFEAQDITPLRKGIPIGASDGASFRKAGIDAVTILGLNTQRHHSGYHTRDDVSASIDPKALEAVRDCVVTYIETVDRSHAAL